MSEKQEGKNAAVAIGFVATSRLPLHRYSCCCTDKISRQKPTWLHYIAVQPNPPRDANPLTAFSPHDSAVNSTPPRRVFDLRPSFPARSSPKRGDRDRDTRDRDRERGRGKDRAKDAKDGKDSRSKDKESKPEEKPKAPGGVDLLSKLAAINARVTGNPAVVVSGLLRRK